LDILHPHTLSRLPSDSERCRATSYFLNPKCCRTCPTYNSKHSTRSVFQQFDTTSYFLDPKHFRACPFYKSTFAPVTRSLPRISVSILYHLGLPSFLPSHSLSSLPILFLPLIPCLPLSFSYSLWLPFSFSHFPSLPFSPSLPCHACMHTRAVLSLSNAHFLRIYIYRYLYIYGWMYIGIETEIDSETKTGHETEK